MATSVTAKELKKMVPRWASGRGVREARLALQLAGIGYSTAEMLRKGEYGPTPGETMCDKLRLAMKDYLAELEAS